MTNTAQEGDFATFDEQFYPTPPSLGRRAFAKFKNKRITRLLEPEAGRGDLADIVREKDDRSVVIECVELDLANQAILRSKGYRVVGTDFLHYRGACVYSHILMNPPFRRGTAHVLHAWELLFTGELVAILNAQDIRNPSSAERQLLVRLIADHGSVEFIRQAFMSEDAKRKATVEIALIHLRKESTEYTSFIDGLRREVEQKHQPAPPTVNEVVIPRDFIENLVLNFECAVEAARQAWTAQARANHFAQRFDRSIAVDEDEESSRVFAPAEPFNTAYDELKERGWSTVLRSTTVLSKLSSQAQRRVEASFKDICTLEFTYENIWGFLDGLIAQQGQIQQDMVCDVFDMISKYHSQNRVYYQGWKSNDKHRLNARSIKSTRFVLPASRRDWYDTFARSLNWDDEQRFHDFDKVFAMLDSKRHEAVDGVAALFRSSWTELRTGQRLSSDYFDVRFYPRAGTFHLFPRRKDLVARMNRVVGQARQWLPHDPEAVPESFWQQFEQAEKVAARMPDLQELSWRAERNWNDLERERAREAMEEAHLKALAELGIHYSHALLLKHEQEKRVRRSQLPLLPAPVE